MDAIYQTLRFLLGIDAEDLSFTQILVRCVVVYLYGIALVRLGKKRFIGKMSGFDTVLAVMIGSILSRAITSENQLFLEILGASLLLILLHRLFAYVASYSGRFGNLVKGHERVLVRDGQIRWDQMHRACLSEQDLMQNVRLNAHQVDLSRVKLAMLERNGDISVVLDDAA